MVPCVLGDFVYARKNMQKHEENNTCGAHGIDEDG